MCIDFPLDIYSAKKYGINGDWEVWLPETYKLIAKRCHIVSAHFDERNRLIINEEKLLDALTRKPTEPNLEFANSYMFH